MCFECDNYAFGQPASSREIARVEMIQMVPYLSLNDSNDFVFELWKFADCSDDSLCLCIVHQSALECFQWSITCLFQARHSHQQMC